MALLPYLPSAVPLHAAQGVASLASYPMQLCKRAWVLPCAIGTILWSPVIWSLFLQGLSSMFEHAMCPAARMKAEAWRHTAAGRGCSKGSTELWCRHGPFVSAPCREARSAGRLSCR